MGRVLGRRSFFGTLAALGTTVCGFVLFGWRSRRSQEDSIARLVDEIGESDDVRGLGLAYLHRHPDQADVDILRAALAPSLGQPALFFGSDPPETALRDAIANDFWAGRTVELDGWVFSQTELRLSALAALQSLGSITPPQLGVFEERVVRYEALAHEPPDTPASDGVVFEVALTVTLDRVYRPTLIETTLAAGHDYGFLYLRDGDEVERQLVGSSRASSDGLTQYRFDVRASGREVDTIRILPWRGLYPYHPGHLRILE